MKSKKQSVKEHLIRHGEITPLEALNEYGSFRLSAIIFDLRREGMEIETVIDKVKHYANYILHRDVDVHGQQEMQEQQAEQNRLSHEQNTLDYIANERY